MSCVLLQMPKMPALGCCTREAGFYLACVSAVWPGLRPFKNCYSHHMRYRKIRHARTDCKGTVWEWEETFDPATWLWTVSGTPFVQSQSCYLVGPQIPQVTVDMDTETERRVTTECIGNQWGNQPLCSGSSNDSWYVQDTLLDGYPLSDIEAQLTPALVELDFTPTPGQVTRFLNYDIQSGGTFVPSEQHDVASLINSSARGMEASNGFTGSCDPLPIRALCKHMLVTTGPISSVCVYRMMNPGINIYNPGDQPASATYRTVPAGTVIIQPPPAGTPVPPQPNDFAGWVTIEGIHRFRRASSEPLGLRPCPGQNPLP